MTSYVSSWHDGNCAMTQAFICETVAGTVPPTTAPPPTLPPKLRCNENDDGWYRMPGNEDFCYKFFADYDGYTHIGKTWKAAEANCSAMGAHLASIHTMDENNYVMVEVSSFPSYLYSYCLYLAGGCWSSQCMDWTQPLVCGGWA